MELLLDTIDGASTEITADGFKATRMGLVTDIPADARSDPYVLMRALMEAGGPTLYDAHPYVPNAYLSRVMARPANDTNAAVVSYEYTGPSPQFGTAAAVFVIEDSTTLAVEQEELDGDGRTIQAIYNYSINYGPGGQGPGGVSYENRTLPRTAAIPVLRPRRSLTVSGLLLGRKQPSAATKLALGTVNDAPWPSGSIFTDDSPLDRGFWLCTNVSSTVERANNKVFPDPKKYPANYKVKYLFSSKCVRDWSSYAFYRNQFGNVPGEPGADEKERADNNEARSQRIAALVKGPYQYGQDHSVNCFVKVGMYKPSNFTSAFGF